MNLTVERRNEIAWKVLLGVVTQSPLKRPEKIVDDLTRSSDFSNGKQLLRFFEELYRAALVQTMGHVAWLDSNSVEQSEQRTLNALAWSVFVLDNHRGAVMNGKLTRGEVYNEAKKVGATTDEAVEFMRQFLAEVTRKIWAG